MQTYLLPTPNNPNQTSVPSAAEIVLADSQHTKFADVVLLTNSELDSLKIVIPDAATPKPSLPGEDAELVLAKNDDIENLLPELPNQRVFQRQTINPTSEETTDIPSLSSQTFEPEITHIEAAREPTTEPDFPETNLGLNSIISRNEIGARQFKPEENTGLKQQPASNLSPLPSTSVPKLETFRSPVEIALLSQQNRKAVGHRNMNAEITVEAKLPSQSKNQPVPNIEIKPRLSSHEVLESVSNSSDPLAKQEVKATVPGDIISLKNLVFETSSPRAERQDAILAEDLPDQRKNPTLQQTFFQAAPSVPNQVAEFVAHVESEPTIGSLKDNNEFRMDTFLDTKQSGHIPQTTPLVRTEFSAPVTRQILDAINARITAEKAIEIALNPAELGRLRLSITPAENGLVVNILAERAEVIELMKRNIADLEQAFSELGHKNISFSFEQGDGFSDPPAEDQPQSSTDHADSSYQISTSNTAMSTSNPDATITSGIDIRV